MLIMKGDSTTHNIQITMITFLDYWLKYLHLSLMSVSNPATSSPLLMASGIGIFTGCQKKKQVIQTTLKMTPIPKIFIRTVLAH